MKQAFLTVGLMALFLLPSISRAEVTSFEQADTTPNLDLPRQAAGQSADLFSAFFGLDSMPRLANVICQSARGQDGMPVIFSTEIDHTTLQVGDFRVLSRSGAVGKMHCASFLPATDPGELRTVLLIGEFGPGDTDPPARVEIIGHIHSIDSTLDFQGAAVDVTPLDPGPTLILAERYDPNLPDAGLGRRRTDGDDCPAEGTVQAVRVVWAGGVTLANGDEPGEAERQLYRVTVSAPDGGLREVAPMALADLGDGDNNHLLCLDTPDMPVSVFFPAGVFTDPNDDLNPDTSISLTPM